MSLSMLSNGPPRTKHLPALKRTRQGWRVMNLLMPIALCHSVETFATYSAKDFFGAFSMRKLVSFHSFTSAKGLRTKAALKGFFFRVCPLMVSVIYFSMKPGRAVTTKILFFTAMCHQFVIRKILF